MPVFRRRPSLFGTAHIGGLLAAALIALIGPQAAAAPAGSASENPEASQDSGEGKEANNNGYDLTRPQNSIDLRFRYEDTVRTATETEREFALLRLTSRIPLSKDWKLALYAEGDALNKKTSSSTSSSTDEAGFGNSVFQAALIQTLSDRWAYGFGARLVAPTAQDDLGSGKWEIMPVFGVRYTFLEWGDNTYFVPAMRYAMSFAGNPSKRDISEPQIAPTFNLGLPDKWFLTLYPSYDIRINFGGPVSGQTGSLFLPADFAIGRKVTDDITMSLEISVPVIKDYPVYDFKTEFRIIITY
jgi:Putative MetA-pathway of phenol degradation